MRSITFAQDNFYHIFNRGVEKRKIFLYKRDFQRFYTALFLFNNRLYRAETGRTCSSLSANCTSRSDVQLILKEPREPLVRILSFCLLPNHFHLLLEECSDKGISTFMHRLTMGYVKYFNKKCDRKGRLFEGVFNATIIDRDEYFRHIPRYIHLNALDVTSFPWRDGKIENWEMALKFLNQYPWSSHRVFMGEPQLLPVVDPHASSLFFDSSDVYVSFLKEWSIRDREQLMYISK